MGDMLHSVILSGSRPSNKLAIKWLMDICKALKVFHSTGNIHLGVRATNVYLNERNTALLGQMGKCLTNYQVSHLADISKL